MTQLSQTTVSDDTLEIQKGKKAKHQFTFPLRRRRMAVTSTIPKGLVVTSDDEVRRRLSQAFGPCGLAPVFASTLAETGMALSRQDIFVVVCHDRLTDGKYEDVLKATKRFDPSVPVIVFSRTGDWPEYLTAIWAGVFDYLAYPPISGELERIIQNAFRESRWQRPLGQSSFSNSRTGVEEP